MTTTRQILMSGLAGSAGASGYSMLGNGWATATTGTLTLASFTPPLQLPPLLNMTVGGSYTLTATHPTQQLHLELPKPTNVWSPRSFSAVDVNAVPYKALLGTTVVVQKGDPVKGTYGSVPWSEHVA